MDGFKNSTKTQYMKGGACKAYAKGGAVKGAAKISKVMGEFKHGELHSGSKQGPVVKNPKQAKAIALSEARKAGAKIPMKKQFGGSVEAGDVLIANMTKDELAAGPKGIKAARERMERQKVGKASDREMRIKEQIKKAVPVPRDRPLISGALGAVTEAERRALRAGVRPKSVPLGALTAAEEKMLRDATRSPSVEAPDQDPRLIDRKHGGKVMKKADGGSVARPTVNATPVSLPSVGPARPSLADTMARVAAVKGARAGRSEVGSAPMARQTLKKGGMAMKKGKC